MTRSLAIILLFTPILAAPTCGEQDISPDEDRKAHGEGEGHEGSVEEHAAQIFTSLDADESGSLAPGEVEGHWMEKKFAKADADGDGLLTLEELTAFKKAHHAK